MKFGKKAIEEDGECLFCDRVWAVFGLVAGAIIMFTSVDLLMNGALSGGFRAVGELADDEMEDIVEGEVVEDERPDGRESV